jgi:DNA-binding transcriptional MerR regulator
MARHPNQSDDVLREIDEIGRLKEQGLRRSEIAKKLKMPESRVKRRLAAYAKKQRLDPQIAQRLEARGITDFAGLHSGWLLEKNEDGSGQSLYFHLGPDQEKVDFADAIREVLSDLPKLAPVAPPETPANDRANFLMVADLHVGAHYGHTALEERCNAAIDDLAARLPKAEKAVLVDLGDLLDANDHKGVTPGKRQPLRRGARQPSTEHTDRTAHIATHGVSVARNAP